MLKREVINMVKLYGLIQKGYAPPVIAKALNISVETVRTIMGALEKDKQLESDKKCA